MASEWKQGLCNCFGDIGTCEYPLLLSSLFCCCHFHDMVQQIEKNLVSSGENFRLPGLLVSLLPGLPECWGIYSNQTTQHHVSVDNSDNCAMVYVMVYMVWETMATSKLSLFNPNVAICILLLKICQGLEKPGIICCLLGCIMPCIPTLLLRSEAREKYNIEGRCKNQIVHFVCASKSEFLLDLLKSSKFSASSETLVPPSAALSVSTARWTNPDLYLIWS